MKNLTYLLVIFLFLGCSTPADNLTKFETEDFLVYTPMMLTRNTEIEQQGMNTMSQMYGKSIDLKLYTGAANNCSMLVSSTNYHLKLTKDNLVSANVGSILNIDKNQPIENIISKIAFHTQNDILYSILEYSLVKKGYNILINSKSCLKNEKIHNLLITCQDSQQNKILSQKIIESFECK